MGRVVHYLFFKSSERGLKTTIQKISKALWKTRRPVLSPRLENSEGRNQDGVFPQGLSQQLVKLYSVICWESNIRESPCRPNGQMQKIARLEFSQDPVQWGWVLGQEKPCRRSWVREVYWAVQYIGRALHCTPWRLLTSDVLGFQTLFSQAFTSAAFIHLSFSSGLSAFLPLSMEVKEEKN